MNSDRDFPVRLSPFGVRMRLTSLSATGYRSLRSIRLDIGRLALFVGENGVGKSNLYRAMQLIKASAEGTLSYEIAREGGMQSALWTGKRRSGPVRMVFNAEFDNDETAIRSGYSVETGLAPSYQVEIGLRPPAAAGFAFEPQIKEETLSIDSGRDLSR